jgi:hypothetical protein
VIVPALMAWAGWLTVSALKVWQIGEVLPRVESKLDALLSMHLKP